MFTEKHFPTSLTGTELDYYLERAWYRMGQSIFTCHFLFFDDNLYSPVWLRLPLAGYQFRKGLRKILEQNRCRFRTLVRPAAIDDEKETLFQLYRENFKGSISATLMDSLLDGQESNVFNTQEIAVYDGDRLVAFSFFDLGCTSLASIKGVFDPSYSSLSLGIYTLLEEIQYGTDHGFRYFYPGYFVPGVARFDYKLRMGKPSEVEFFDLKFSSWEPYARYSVEEVPVNLLSARLNRVAQALVQSGIPVQMLFYPAYEANIFGYHNERFLEAPLFLALFCNVFPRPRFIVFYDLWKEKYVFTHCMPLEDLGFYFEYSMQFDNPEARHFLDFILTKTQIIETQHVETIVRLANEIGKLIKPPGTRGVLK